MKKYENFCRSLENLKDIYSCEEPYDNVIITGLVGLYQICFEQAWKAMKEVLSFSGIPEAQTGSPRQVLKSAYQVGMIKDEDIWLAALVSRNNVALAYNHDIAKEIILQTKEKYYPMFVALKEELEKNWELQ